MKRWFSLVVVLLLFGASVGRAESVQETYARGVRAYTGGNVDAARDLFLQVLAADPQNQPAAAYLKRIAATKPANAGLRARLEKIIVPKVEFRDASLSTVLDYLPQVVQQQSGGKAALNIVRMFPTEYGRDKHITLQLSGAPVTSVLDYVAQLGGLKVEYQAHAVVMSLANAEAPPAAAQPAAP